jgi:uncharacterized membrane protein YeaQ/YmgE (transglycosylase-associated protein family)
MDILITLVVGGIIGWLASLVMGTNGQMGIITNILVGIVGTWLGFWLAPKMGLFPSDGLGRWLVAVGGAILLILVLKVVGAFR